MRICLAIAGMMLAGETIGAQPPAAQPAAAPPAPTFAAQRPLYPDAAPVRTCECLTALTLPDTTIEAAVADSAGALCRVTAVVTHPPAGERERVGEDRAAIERMERPLRGDGAAK